MNTESLNDCLCDPLKGIKWTRKCPIHGIPDKPSEISEYNLDTLVLAADRVLGLMSQWKKHYGYSSNCDEACDNLRQEIREHLRTSEPVSGGLYDDVQGVYHGPFTGKAQQPVEMPSHASTGLDSLVTRLEKALRGARATNQVRVSARDLNDILWHFIRMDNTERKLERGSASIDDAYTCIECEDVFLYGGGGPICGGCSSLMNSEQPVDCWAAWEKFYTDDNDQRNRIISDSTYGIFEAGWQARASVRESSKQPINKVRAVVAEIDRLAAMTCDQLLSQRDVAFLELMDMALTLRNEIEGGSSDAN